MRPTELQRIEPAAPSIHLFSAQRRRWRGSQLLQSEPEPTPPSEPKPNDPQPRT